jgi:hypothetical protein
MGFISSQERLHGQRGKICMVTNYDEENDVSVFIKKLFLLQWSHTLNQIHLFYKGQKFIQFSSCVLYASHAWCSRCCCCCCCLAKKSEKRFRRMLTICYGNRWLVGCGFVAKEPKKKQEKCLLTCNKFMIRKINVPNICP